MSAVVSSDVSLKAVLCCQMVQVCPRELANPLAHAAQDMVIVLREAVGFVTHIL